jgi:hypothetical protein
VSGGDGTLSFTIWPTYVGVSSGAPAGGVHWEPTDLGYQRGQIAWELEDGQIVGRAKIDAPAGHYTHLLYFHHPEHPQSIGSVQLPHPVDFPTAGVIDVYPITNADLELLKPYNA